MHRGQCMGVIQSTAEPDRKERDSQCAVPAAGIGQVTVSRIIAIRDEAENRAPALPAPLGVVDTSVIVDGGSNLSAAQ
jgi:hypothetical protein